MCQQPKVWYLPIWWCKNQIKDHIYMMFLSSSVRFTQQVYNIYMVMDHMATINIKERVKLHLLSTRGKLACLSHWTETWMLQECVLKKILGKDLHWKELLAGVWVGAQVFIWKTTPKNKSPSKREFSHLSWLYGAHLGTPLISATRLIFNVFLWIGIIFNFMLIEFYLLLYWIKKNLQLKV